MIWLVLLSHFFWVFPKLRIKLAMSVKTEAAHSLVLPTLSNLCWFCHLIGKSFYFWNRRHQFHELEHWFLHFFLKKYMFYFWEKLYLHTLLMTMWKCTTSFFSEWQLPCYSWKSGQHLTKIFTLEISILQSKFRHVALAPATIVHRGCGISK